MRDGSCRNGGRGCVQLGLRRRLWQSRVESVRLTCATRGADVVQQSTPGHALKQPGGGQAQAWSSTFAAHQPPGNHTHTARGKAVARSQPCELRGEAAEHSLLLHGDTRSWQGWALWEGIGGSLQEGRNSQELYDRSVMLRCCSKQDHHNRHQTVRKAEGRSGESVSAGGAEGDEATIVWRDEGKRGGDVMSTTLPSARVKGHLRSSSSLHVFIHRLTLTPCRSSNMLFECKLWKMNSHGFVNLITIASRVSRLRSDVVSFAQTHYVHSH